MSDKGKVMFIAPNLKGYDGGVNRIQPPLGAMIMAEVLRKEGYSTHVLDTALEGWNHRVPMVDHAVMIGLPEAEIKKKIGEFDPQIVAISALFSNLIYSTHDIARIVKEVNPKTEVVLGGNHMSNATSDYEFASANPGQGLQARLTDMEDINIDFAMRGESDFAFPSLVQARLEGKDFSNIPGLVMRTEPGKYRVNPSERVQDLAQLPIPARDLVNMDGYFNIGAFHSTKTKSGTKRVLNVMASRGCPEKCTFCTTPQMWGSKVRWRPIESIVDEIKGAVRDYKVEEIQWDDDTITANIKHLYELCGELEKIRLPWCTPNGIKTNYHLANQPEMFKRMADAGCYQVTLACESGVQRVLDKVIGKNLNIDQIKPAIKNAIDAGMFVHTFWILGYPGETREELQQTVDFAKGSGADSYSFAILNPLPGTPIYRQVVRENLWWPGRGLEDMMFRTSLIKVPGFNSPEEFESYVNKTNIETNRLLWTRDPQRYIARIGHPPDDRSDIKQT